MSSTERPGSRIRLPTPGLHATSPTVSTTRATAVMRMIVCCSRGRGGSLGPKLDHHPPLLHHHPLCTHTAV